MPEPVYVDRKNMGLDFGLESDNFCPKRKNRWLLMVEGVCGVADALPPLKGARPSLDFKEQTINHLSEIISYPVKVEWRAINVTLYDIKQNKNPVFDWISQLYNPRPSPDRKWNFLKNCGKSFKKNVILCMYDGCGSVIESWKLENAYPQNADWGDLDMAGNEVVTVSFNLKYDRAYPLSDDASGGNEGSQSGFSGNSGMIDNPCSENQPSFNPESGTGSQNIPSFDPNLVNPGFVIN